MKKSWFWVIVLKSWFWVIVLLGIFAMVYSNRGATLPLQRDASSQISSQPNATMASKANQIESAQTKSNLPTEYRSALNKAQMYNDSMYMSKDGLYEQLTSEYGEKFSAGAAKYAIDNVDANWRENALKKAKQYQDDMAMSPDAILEQLSSEYGEKFTVSEAKYAVDNLE